jgi:arabinofuranan 3-O-arabinosyltransferase
LVACLALLVIDARRDMSAAHLLSLGAGLTLAAGVTFVLVTSDLRSEPGPGMVTESLWPHWLAGAGLVVAIAGAWRLDSSPDRRPAPRRRSDG